MSKLKVTIVTGSRAEYGLLKPLIEIFNNDENVLFSLVVTGSHLSKEHGQTIIEIYNDGFNIFDKVEMLPDSDSTSSIASACGQGVIKFSELFQNKRPDLLIVLGDRYEIFSVCVSATFMKIPIAHIHGGETTFGSIDETLRHSITKMSHIHFPANETYKKRIIQLGENPESVFEVGSLGVDNILKNDFMQKNDLEEILNFKFKKQNLLVVFHSETLGLSSKKIFSELLDALSTLNNIGIIFTFTNNDADSKIINQKIVEYTNLNKNAVAFQSLGQKLFLSLLNVVDGIVGNSSSGIIEAPTIKTGTLNIGSRQSGRVKAKSVIDCEADKVSIIRSIEKLLSSEFQNELNKTVNPYGNGGAAKKIYQVIKNIKLDRILQKKFYDF